MEEKAAPLQVLEGLKENAERVLQEKDTNIWENVTMRVKTPVPKSTGKPSCSRKPMLTALAIEAKKDCEINLVQQQVFHSGVPMKLYGPVRHTTIVRPFSFEERDKAAQKKKEEKLQKMKEEAEKQQCTVFHARPVPAYLKKNRFEK